MRVRFALVAALLIHAAFTVAQTYPKPLTVDFCQLVTNAAQYAGNEVQVRGRIHNGFEDFTMSDDNCPGYDREVWLQYGDDLKGVKYWQHLAGKGRNLPQIGFLRDSQSQRFNDSLNASRIFMPNGDDCPAEQCSYYTTYATVTGWLMEGKHPGKPFGGLGHMGCCFLLVMHRVSAVTGVRTKVPVAGVYRCETQRWEKIDLVPEQPPSSRTPRNFHEWQTWRLKAYAQLATHWQDPPPTDGSGSIYLNRWISSDLLRSYQIDVPLDRGTASATRIVCVRLGTDSPPELTRCMQKIWPERGKKPRRNLPPAEEMELAARLAITSAKTYWDVTSPEVLTNLCKHTVFQNQDFGDCSFVTADGLDSFRVSLQRRQKKHHSDKYSWDGIPWSASGVHGSFCSVDGE